MLCPHGMHHCVKVRFEISVLQSHNIRIASSKKHSSSHGNRLKSKISQSLQAHKLHSRELAVAAILVSTRLHYRRLPTQLTLLAPEFGHQSTC